jgi:hypothetical protein
MTKSSDSYKQASSEGREGGEEEDNLIASIIHRVMLPSSVGAIILWLLDIFWNIEFKKE